MFSRPSSLFRQVGIPLLALLGSSALLCAQSWKENATYTLPDTPLAEFLQSHLGLTVDDDHGIKLGGIGSDLWHAPSDGPGIFWMITDRGPNGEIDVSGSTRRTFPIPEFTPFILKVHAHDGVLEVLEAIPITGFGPALAGVTGLSNSLPRDEKPYDCSATIELDVNPHGLDTEGLVRTSDGNFWSVEEYSPSIIKVDPQGKVVNRFLPPGLNLPITGYPFDDSPSSVPSIFGAKRKGNRGFEGLALSPDEEFLYVALQSPLSNPTSGVGNPSRNTRILAFHIPTETIVAEYVYRFQPSAEFTIPGVNNARSQDMKVSGLASLDQHRMLVLERTDFMAKVYVVDLRKGTNILGSPWDDLATSPSLEATNTEEALAAAETTPLPKQLVVTLDSTQAGIPQKIEGIAVLDGKTLAFANDNDFGIGSFDMTNGCTLIDSGLKSRLLVMRLNKSFK